MHKIILLSSAANVTGLVPPSAIQQFAWSLYGYVNLMEENPRKCFKDVDDAIVSHLPGEAWLELRLALEMDTLAEILYKVFEALHDADNHHIILEGSCSGLFIATLFQWLHQDKTSINIRNDRILPLQGDTDSRLYIILKQNQGDVSRWKLQKLRRLASLTPEQTVSAEELGGSKLDYPLPRRTHNHYPIETARNMMREERDPTEPFAEKLKETYWTLGDNNYRAITDDVECLGCLIQDF